MNVWYLLKTGGPTMMVLLLCSIVSFAIIVERVLYYKRSAKARRDDFMRAVLSALEKKNTAEALELCKKTDAPFSRVVHAGLSLSGQGEKVISNGMERRIVVETTHLEKLIDVEGTLGSTSVYIGLFGTVLGIMKAFHDIAASGSGGINVVIGGISESLLCTAAGLFVAVPAVIAYNFFVKRIDSFVTDMELCASEISDWLGKK